jgi:hypothetical protein
MQQKAKECPILFSTPMVQAILEGRKTVTRRIVKPQPDDSGLWNHSQYPMSVDSDMSGWWGTVADIGEQKKFTAKCEVGDILWVRETWTTLGYNNGNKGETDAYVYKASENGIVQESNSKGWRWRPSIFMPREACRLFLKVKSVKVERLHTITPEDASREGVRYAVSPSKELDMVYPCFEVKENGALSFMPESWTELNGDSLTDALLYAHFAELWCDINGRESWDANPWVWVIEFEKLESYKHKWAKETTI